jgi:hypothetical protein
MDAAAAWRLFKKNPFSHAGEGILDRSIFDHALNNPARLGTALFGSLFTANGSPITTSPPPPQEFPSKNRHFLRLFFTGLSSAPEGASLRASFAERHDPLPEDLYKHIPYLDEAFMEPYKTLIWLHQSLIASARGADGKQKKPVPAISFHKTSFSQGGQRDAGPTGRPGRAQGR